MVPLAFGFAVGIAIQTALPARAWWIVWFGALAVAAVSLGLGWRHAALGALVPAMVALGAVRAVPPPLARDHVAHLSLPQTVDLEGRVLADPVTFGPDRQRVVLDVESVDGGARTGRIHLTVYGRVPWIQEGNRIGAEARLRDASGFRNPDGFDYGAFLEREHVHVVATAVASRVRILDTGSPWHARVRRHALDRMHATIPPASAALLGGLLLGARTELPPEILDGFRRAGVFHVLAVSGLHVGLVAAAVFAAVVLGGGSRVVASITAMAAISGYAAVAGPRPSVVRALIMGLLVLAALLLERENSVLNSLALAAILILAWRPNDLFNPGFQLSFAATAGIVLAPLPRRRFAGAIGVSVAAQLAVLPITLGHFNQFSTVGTVANLGVVPLAAVATVAGFAAVALTALSDTVAAWVFDFVWPVLLAMRALVWLAGAVPGALVYLPSPHGLAIACYVGALATGLGAWHARATHRRAALAGGLGAAGLLVGAVVLALWPVLRPGDARLRVAVLDVGQADAVVIETPDRQTVVIAGALGGGGRFDLGERVVAPYLWNRGILKIDALLTPAGEEPDGGVATLRRLFPVRDVLTAADPATRRVGPVTISLLARRDLASAEGAEPVVALRLDYRLASFLFLFDIGPAMEQALARGVLEPRAVVLKLARHGARRSVSLRLLEVVRPTIAVVSRGARGPHAELHPEILASLEQGGAAVYRTDRDGAVILETDGEVLEVTRWALRETDRYCLDPEHPCATVGSGPPPPLAPEPSADGEIRARIRGLPLEGDVQ